MVDAAWSAAEGLIYPNYEVTEIEYTTDIQEKSKWFRKSAKIGADYGTANPTAYVPLLELTRNSGNERETIYYVPERVRLGESPSLQLTEPGANYPVATFGETVEKYKPDTYGIQIKFTRQAMVDDRTNELMKVISSGYAASELETLLVYYQLVNGTVGGQAAFSAANNNLITGKPITDDDVKGGVQEMDNKLANQTGLDSKRTLGMKLGKLIVPPDLYYNAKKYRTSVDVNLHKELNVLDDYDIIREP